uniref:Dual specificity protein kinase TTK n=1 Tax=Geotrypetes seraphini TaxID=260995 RepID=A0A6P8QDW9_GEOSA|nr:dual specificity protein kinase TTK [Geotrypetes seraphini]XP_033794714.1 dual specificity protein kinase TTK [Geotrypetes seraphini]XP_033794715.1 dual specificity protein kinase TTK [Geotrypetes seraphini]
MEEDLNEWHQKLAAIKDRVRSLKTKHQTEENLTDELYLSKRSTDSTDHSGTVNKIMMTTNSPEDWLNFLLKSEKKGNLQTDSSLLNKMIDLYNRAVVALPAEKYNLNESYAQILVRFAELKALIDPDDARDQFQLARVNCKKFAFVHIALAQFELSQGDYKKSKRILQKAVECWAVPMEMLEIATRNLNLKKKCLLPEDDKENVAVMTISGKQEIFQASLFQNSRDQKKSDGAGEFPATDANPALGEKTGCLEESEAKNKSFPNMVFSFGRVPLQSVLSPPMTPSLSTDAVNPSIRRHTSEILCTYAASSFPKPKKSEDDSCDMDKLKFSKISSPAESWLPPNKDGLEATADSSIPLNGMEYIPASSRRSDIQVMGKELGVPLFNQQEHRAEPDDSSNCQKPLELPKKNGAEKECTWKVAETTSKEKHTSLYPPILPVSKRVTPPGTAPKKQNCLLACETPGNSTLNMSCFRTPVVKNELAPVSKVSTPYCLPSGYQQQPQTPATPFQIPGCLQVTTPLASNECIVIKGRVYTILRQIGAGGSSKVFQVMDDKKRLYAIKYVDLDEADPQTNTVYQNEISYLRRLQKHSDKIIRLYDHEITEDHIYMVMECGNIDLNSWLKKKKSICPWERKSYWKNMLEAVNTIHEYGIVHSDLKPANFLIVDGMLKLIDFGIANQMQPDVTSIVKDSPFGTLNFMAPEAIKVMSSHEEPRSKISCKSDVWSLGCILYYMTYGRTPFQHITNHFSKLQTIINPGYEIEFPDIPEKDLLDVLKKCLVRNYKQRISIPELLVHPYVQIQPHSQPERQVTAGTEEVKRILGQLICLNSPNSISRAAKSLYEQCSIGKSLDVSEIAKDSSQAWTMK